MIVEAIFASCLVVGRVDPVKKEITTQTKGCETTQSIMPDGSLRMERTDNHRSVCFTLPVPNGKKPYEFSYSFGEDKVYFSDSEERSVIHGYGGV